MGLFSLIKTNGQGMHQTFKQALMVLCVFMQASLGGLSCPYKECTCNGPNIYCSGLHLTTLPVMLPVEGAFVGLYIDDNSITEIPARSMPPNLTRLYIQENPITTVADMAFDDSASTLTTLYFSSALFTRIPDAFRHLNSLSTLNMQDLNITDWNGEAMTNFGQTMVTLSLYNVGLKSWPDWLKPFFHLSKLIISKNSISKIPDDALDSSASTLIFLTMNNNKLTEVPKAFSKLTSLQELYLQNNFIVDVSWLPPSSSLTSLWLNNNLISDANVLSKTIRPYAQSLLVIDISSNRLTSVPNVTFLMLIENLDLSNNRISDPYSGAVGPKVSVMDFAQNFLPAIPCVLTTLQTVYELSLSFNSIKQIQASDFPITATVIELQSNLITELTDNSFPINSKITDLNLNNNPIATISSGAFSNLGQLTELNLQGARLTRVPLAVRSLPGMSMYKLDLFNNTNLVCTCMEKSVEHWVVSNNVVGNCGLIGIKQFFTILSPSCP